MRRPFDDGESAAALAAASQFAGGIKREETSFGFVGCATTSSIHPPPPRPKGCQVESAIVLVERTTLVKKIMSAMSCR